MVIPPGILIQVALKMFSGHRVVHTCDPTTYQRPEVLDRLRVERTGDDTPLEWLTLDDPVRRRLSLTSQPKKGTVFGEGAP